MYNLIGWYNYKFIIEKGKIIWFMDWGYFVGY